MLILLKDLLWVTETMLVSLGLGRHVSCLVGTDWTHIHSAVSLAGTRAACHMHTSNVVHLGLCAVLVSLSLWCIPSPPFSFSCCFPFVILQSLLSLLVSLVLKRASLPDDHVISKKPFGHQPLALSGCGEKLQK